MRRRWTLASIPMHIDKGSGKNHKKKLCFLLTSLCILFWGFLLYYYFVALGGASISVYYGTTTTLESNPIKIEHFNSDSSTKPEEIRHTHVTSHGKIGAKSEPGHPNPVVSKDPVEVKSSKSEPKDPSSDPEEVEHTNVRNHSKIQDTDKSHPIEVKTTDGGSDTEDEPKDPTPKDKPRDFPFMRALRTSEDKRDPCGGKYIYVHNLPSRFNKDMLKACRTLSRWTNMCRYTTNAGLGPPLKNVRGVFSKTGWYATNQFAVDVIFNNRMKQYKCLTNDSSLAAAIFVPFYAGFDIARYLWGYNISTRDAASLDLVKWLTKRPEWKIMDGRDHFLVAGRITWDFRRLTERESDWGSKLLFLPAAKNMSMLVVESSPWNANDFAIPYPTYFHPAKDSDVFFWQNRMRKLKRQWLFSFAGAPRPGNPKSIRGQIINQCKKSISCRLLECDSGESKCHSPSSIMKMFQSSLFCLQPQGDSYTRRSAFDAMLAGCIPVFFHPGSAYTQYTWHLPKNYSSYSVFISENDVRKGSVRIEDRLREIPPHEVRRMRETVIGLIPRLVYADPRSRLETLEDAFDVSVQAVIDKVTNLRRNIIQGRTEYDGFVEQNSWKYALLGEGQREVGAHEWDPFFSKPKEGEEDPKSSWKNEQRSQLR